MCLLEAGRRVGGYGLHVVRSETDDGASEELLRYCICTYSEVPSSYGGGNRSEWGLNPPELRMPSLRHRSNVSRRLRSTY